VTSESRLIYFRRDFYHEIVIFTEEEENSFLKELEKNKNFRKLFSNIMGGMNLFLTVLNPIMTAPFSKYF